MSTHFFHFQSFQSPQMHHAITTRELHGADSSVPYANLNLAFHVGDDPDHVCENRLALAHSFGCSIDRLHAARQTHGSHIQIVASTDPARGALDWNSAWPDTDALVTGDAGVPLLILVADCAPILLADFEARVLAVVHAGWRGATARIASKTIEKMTSCGAHPSRIRAGIGPHLCPACFETGEEVAAAASAIAPGAVLRTTAKPHLNLDTLIRTDLTDVGVTKIETLPHCPRCENHTFFSHRAQNGQAGRFGLIVQWNER